MLFYGNDNQEVMMKTKAHIRYKTKDGMIVPGVTTILGLLNKPALVPWANRLGLEGIDVAKYVDDKADIGTLAHALATDHLLGRKTDISHYDVHQIDKAENAALSFFSWLDKNPIEPISVEEPLVSETLCFGGTVDIYGRINGKYVLVDLKTGSGIWPEYGYQIAAYASLLEENGSPIDYCVCLNIPRVESEAFKEHTYTALEREVGWEIFKSCLNIYQQKKRLK